jgi:hypothetical protein
MKSPMICSVAMAAALVVGLSPVLFGTRQGAGYLTGPGKKNGRGL